MMRPLLFAGCILTCAYGLARAQESVESPDFSVYRQTYSNPIDALSNDAFVASMLTRNNGAWHWASNHLLSIKFLVSPGQVFFGSVDVNGVESDDCQTNFSVRHDHQRQLDSTELMNLRFALFDLPTASVLPPVERLVVVGFRADERWIIRSYDAAALPTAVYRIREIIDQVRQVSVSFEQKIPFNMRLGASTSFDPKTPFNTQLND